MIAFCIFLNYFGRLLAVGLSMPFWLDSFGTVLCAYMTGPICGALVGGTSNLIFHVTTGANPVYALISIAIGVIAGFPQKKTGNAV